MNYFDIQNNFITVTPNKTEKIIKTLNNYIASTDCKKMYVDISALNLIDAVKTSSECSVKHFLKYPYGELKWIVKDKETCSTLKPLALKTTQTIIKQPIIKDFQPVKREKVVAIR